MPRGPVVASPVPGAVPQNPGDVIQSSVWNATVDDIYNIFNTIQPIEYGGNGVADGKPLDNSFGVKNSTDPTKVMTFDASGITTGTTRVLTAPNASGTIALTSDLNPQKGYLFGLTLSNNAVDAANDIDVTAGEASSAAATAALITLASSLTKRLDAVWAVGTNQGMLASGAAISNTTYHIFLIKRPDTGVVDVAADSSVTGANIAANTNVAYTLIRRIGSIIRAGGVIKPFVQNGDIFSWLVPSADVSSTNPGTSAVTRTLTLPIGLKVLANLSVSTSALNGNTDGPVSVLISDLALTDVPASNSAFSYQSYNASTIQNVGGSIVNVMSNTSAQVRSRVELSTSGLSMLIVTNGYQDTRGRLG